jgi:pyruvoyl-dependent arginine decarboxylase (PvlArgDC)
MTAFSTPASCAINDGAQSYMNALFQNGIEHINLSKRSGITVHPMIHVPRKNSTGRTRLG